MKMKMEDGSTANVAQSSQLQDVLHARQRVLDLLAKHTFDGVVLKYLSARESGLQDSQVSADNASNGNGCTVNHIWNSIPLSRNEQERLDDKQLSVSQDSKQEAPHEAFHGCNTDENGCGILNGMQLPSRPWLLPSYEVYLDCSRILCSHMKLYGMDELLNTGMMASTSSIPGEDGHESMTSSASTTSVDASGGSASLKSSITQTTGKHDQRLRSSRESNQNTTNSTKTSTIGDDGVCPTHQDRNPMAPREGESTEECESPNKYIRAFWTFTDASLTYNILYGLVQVLRSFFHAKVSAVQNMLLCFP